MRFKRCLLDANFSTDLETIKLLIKDKLAKSWIQSKLKDAGLFHDNSFNKEAITIETAKFIQVMELLFYEEEISSFKEEYQAEISKEKSERKRNRLLQEIKDWSGLAIGTISVSS